MIYTRFCTRELNHSPVHRTEYGQVFLPVALIRHRRSPISVLKKTWHCPSFVVTFGAELSVGLVQFVTLYTRWRHCAFTETPPEGTQYCVSHGTQNDVEIFTYFSSRQKWLLLHFTASSSVLPAVYMLMLDIYHLFNQRYVGHGAR